MREILFRGKREDNGRWIQGDYQHFHIENDIYVYIGRWGEEMRSVKPETVGQFTGLTDKNGTKIFEGDILSENGYLFVVVWDQAWARFKLQHDGRCYQYPEWNRGIQMEIVGNIHDNPELLEVL